MTTEDLRTPTFRWHPAELLGGWHGLPQLPPIRICSASACWRLSRPDYELGGAPCVARKDYRHECSPEYRSCTWRVGGRLELERRRRTAPGRRVQRHSAAVPGILAGR